MQINQKYCYVRVSSKSQEEKSLGVTQIARLVGLSPLTVYKVLKKHLGYVSNRLVKQDHK